MELTVLGQYIYRFSQLCDKLSEDILTFLPTIFPSYARNEKYAWAVCQWILSYRLEDKEAKFHHRFLDRFRKPLYLDCTSASSIHITLISSGNHRSYLLADK